MLVLELLHATLKYIYENSTIKLSRMSERDQQDFIKEYVTWMKGPDVKFESLQIFNFGYERSLPLPSVALDSNSSSRLNLQTSGLQTPSKWSMVVIGKKCVRRFLELMTTIAQIHEDTQALPFAVFVESEDDIKIRNISSHVTPTLVVYYTIQYTLLSYPLRLVPFFYYTERLPPVLQVIALSIWTDLVNYLYKY